MVFCSTLWRCVLCAVSVLRASRWRSGFYHVGLGRRTTAAGLSRRDEFRETIIRVENSWAIQDDVPWRDISMSDNSSFVIVVLHTWFFMKVLQAMC